MIGTKSHGLGGSGDVVQGVEGSSWKLHGELMLTSPGAAGLWTQSLASTEAQVGKGGLRDWGGR